MNRIWLIAGLCTFASIGVSACSEAPRATQADDISPIDGQKLRAFNTWLDAVSYTHLTLPTTPYV